MRANSPQARGAKGAFGTLQDRVKELPLAGGSSIAAAHDWQNRSEDRVAHLQLQSLLTEYRLISNDARAEDRAAPALLWVRLSSTLKWIKR